MNPRLIVRHMRAPRCFALAAALLAGGCAQILGIEDLSSGDAGPGPSLASVVVDGVAPAISLVPGTTEYQVELPLLQQSVTLTAAVATPGDTLTIAGTAVASGTPSAPIALSLGENSVDIVVENGTGGRRTYRLTLRRAAEIAQYAYAKSPDPGLNDIFGYSVALSGDTLAVGAYQEDSAATGVGGNPANDGATDTGAVFVFRRAGTIWQQEAYLKASTTDTEDWFGFSVALSGDTLAVAAVGEDSAAAGVGGDQDDDSADTSGAVYVFQRTGSTWQQEAYIKASNPGAFDNFGWSVALSGDVLVVGATGEASAAQGVDGDQGDNTAADSGAAYVFRRSGSTWQQEAYLKASNAEAGDGFGNSVALSGDVLAVAAYLEDSAARGVDADQGNNVAEDSGAVYVFRRPSATWQQETYIKASNPGAFDNFGRSVAVSGDVLVVGADGEDSGAPGVGGNEDDDSASGSGAAYVFRRTGSGWQQEVYLKASNPGIDDYFGASVALSGDVLAVGASGEDSAATGVNGDQVSNAAEQSGAVYIFH